MNIYDYGTWLIVYNQANTTRYFKSANELINYLHGIIPHQRLTGVSVTAVINGRISFVDKSVYFDGKQFYVVDFSKEPNVNFEWLPEHRINLSELFKETK